MRFLKWLGAAVGAILLTILLLDTFGGYLFDGPLGPIPGGALSGPVNSTEKPDWSKMKLRIGKLCENLRNESPHRR